MFSGIVEQCGTIKSIKTSKTGVKLAIECRFDDLNIGESIAVNGICLTVNYLKENQFFVDISSETLDITTVKYWVVNDRVNLERSLTLSTGISGHLVSGHVDITAKIEKLIPNGECTECVVGGFANQALPYLMDKGSITVDGVSLTINRVENSTIYLMLIPHTFNVTALNTLEEGQLVNIEYDYLARIVLHQLKQFKLPVEVMHA